MYTFKMSIRPSEILFDREKSTILLSLSKEDVVIPDFVKPLAKAEGLSEKPEVHVTVLGFGAGQKITKRLNDLLPEERERIRNALGLLAADAAWKIELTPHVYRIQKSYTTKDGRSEERTTFILMVDIPEIAEFVRQASELVGMPLETPPPHITIYSKSTLPDNQLAGIGIASSEDFKKVRPIQLTNHPGKHAQYVMIALPTRAQPDTIIAIFILKHFGKEHFPGIEDATFEVVPRLPDNETEESLAQKGMLLVDVGGGMFDHHSKPYQTTASSLITEYLGQKNNPALLKLLQFAERDDFYGKGIVSTDPLDRAFGLPGLIASLNRKYVQEPAKVVEIVIPLIDAFYAEEEKRAFEMPKELEDKLRSGRADAFTVRHRGKTLKGIIIETDNPSMAGFLRSRGGGGYDVIALRLPTGHTNILTKQVQPRVDLRSLCVLLRIQEAEARGVALEGSPESLSVAGTMKEVPQWYFDPATNSLLNGGPNPQGIEATTIDPFEFRKLLEVGLSEQLWQPR